MKKCIRLVGGILVFSVVIGSAAFGKDNKGEPTLNQKRNVAASPENIGIKATGVASSATINVYRFIDVVEDQRFVCYFTEGSGLRYSENPGNVTCYPIAKK